MIHRRKHSREQGDKGMRETHEEESLAIEDRVRTPKQRTREESREHPEMLQLEDDPGREDRPSNSKRSQEGVVMKPPKRMPRTFSPAERVPVPQTLVPSPAATPLVHRRQAERKEVEGKSEAEKNF